jgi:hypothetical protein
MRYELPALFATMNFTYFGCAVTIKGEAVFPPMKQRQSELAMGWPGSRPGRGKTQLQSARAS